MMYSVVLRYVFSVWTTQAVLWIKIETGASKKVPDFIDYKTTARIWQTSWNFRELAECKSETLMRSQYKTLLAIKYLSYFAMKIFSYEPFL